MAKFELRIKAREMRSKGASVKKIAASLGVSKGTASIWVRDIILTIEQLEALKKSSLAGSERGRLKNALIQKKKWQANLEEFIKIGKKSLSNITDREFLISGLALYWAEGCKKTRRVEFCNSDPKMIQFLLLWFRKCFQVEDVDIRCCVGINQAHRHREGLVKQYWSDITGIPLSQFHKTSFKKVISKKVYENFDKHYGTLAIRINRPSRFYSKIIGYIEGLYHSGYYARVAQRQ